MRNRPWFSLNTLAIAIAAALCAPTFLAAQTQSATQTIANAAAKTNTSEATKKPWVLPRTPDGQPDLHGYWTSLSFTPMERPAKYGNREFLTEKETQDIFNAGVRGSFDGAAGTGDAENDPTSADYDFKTYGLSPWQNGVRPNRRTSLVVDPPEGRIPPLTPAGEARRKAAQGYFIAEEGNWQGKVHADVAKDLGVGVTCVAEHGGPPIVPGGYNSGLMIVQGRDSIVIQTEYGSEVRIIPLDRGPHPSANIHQWHGDGRGRWVGDTLVVETTNFRPENTYRNANPGTLKISEYFTRIDAETIEYKFTVNDPNTWTKPWTAIVPLSSVQGPLWEYACSESNNDAIQIMVGARNAEKAEAEKPKTPAGVPISQSQSK
jgi:hypothetical protein